MNSNEILRLNALKVAENWYQLITDLHTHMMCACVDVSVLCLRHTSECRTLYVYGCEGLVGLSCVYVALHACDPVVRMGMAACLITSVWVRLPMIVGVLSWLSSLLLFFWFHWKMFVVMRLAVVGRNIKEQQRIKNNRPVMIDIVMAFDKAFIWLTEKCFFFCALFWELH